MDDLTIEGWGGLTASQKEANGGISPVGGTGCVSPGECASGISSEGWDIKREITGI